MAGASTSTSPTPMEMTENNGTPNEGGEMGMPNEQWRAISMVIDRAYAHREPE